MNPSTQQDEFDINEKFSMKDLFFALGLLLCFGLMAYSLVPLIEEIRTDPTQHVTPASHGSPEESKFASCNISEVRLGNRVAGHNPQISDAERAAWADYDPDPATLRGIDLLLPKEDGSLVEIALLRDLAWLEAVGVSPEPAEHDPELMVDHAGEVVGVRGTLIPLALSEMGAEGEAIVLSVRLCPPLRPGDGQLVTGTFAHLSAEVVDLRLQGEPQPIGVTATHPFWSVDRQDFVAVEDLRTGERVQTVDGYDQVVSIVPRAGPEKVYNIEVHGEHVYRVAHGGILVHNRCSVPSRIREAVQGRYIDPYTNKIVYTSERLSVDHIYPVAKIKGLDGFKHLTPEQKRKLLNFPQNFMGTLPRLNSSKGARLGDEVDQMLGRGTSKAYRNDLQATQEALERNFQTMIQEMLKNK